MRLQLTYRTGSIAALGGLVVLATAANAVAQEPLPSQPPVIQPLPPPPPSEAYPPPAPPPPPLPPPPPPGAVTVTVQTTPPEEEKPVEAASPLHLSAFVDAYYAFQTSQQGTPVPPHFAYAFGSPGRTAENGFSLSFAGVDATYDGGQLGATISLRAGPSVNKYYGGDSSPLGIENITQAYVTWTPVQELSIDFGQFATIFGAEVAESWQNLNYTRGALYYLMQPFWHTGLRVSVSPSEQVSITGMIVNGVNTISEACGLLSCDPASENESPSLALQLSLTPNEFFSLAGGWYTTLQPSTDGSYFANFFDLVASLTIQRLSLVFNADLGVADDIERAEPGYRQTLSDPRFWGISLAAGYQATDSFGIAVRGEVLSDDDNILYGVRTTQFGVTFPTTTQTNLGTLTGTLDFKPVPGSSNLIIRWDNRLEFSNKDIFFNRTPDSDVPNTDVWFGSVLGVVVTTDG
ncbi:MAG: outer membrane beta-barrel protein [Polyangiaceae bacterium]